MPRFYKLFLKILLAVVCIPLAIVVIISLGTTGFLLDFGGSSNTMYWLFLPLIFVGVIVWAAYLWSRRSRQQAYHAAVTTGRNETLQAYGIGDTPEALVLALLKQRGPLTPQQLSTALHMPKDQLLIVTRNLLSSKAVRQQVSDQEITFSVDPNA